MAGVSAPDAGAGQPTSYPMVDVVLVRALVAGSVENLLATWDERQALFPYSSRLYGSRIVNDYANEIAVRYTINSLLGLLRNARCGDADVAEPIVGEMIDAFLVGPGAGELLPADEGLATVLLAELGADAAAMRARARTLAGLLAHGAAALNMQDLAWILWGAAAAARAGVCGARDIVSDALDLITADFVDHGTGLPRHSTVRYRRDVVSFGSLTYFLRAMHEAADVLGDPRAHGLFRSGVDQAIGLQGPLGEWPWMINCRTGSSFDFYPVFAVHQDSMAMLFLHPAAGRAHLGAADAVGRSLSWVFGDNELQQQMYVREPFFAHRSIERSERAPRVRRYLRSVPRSAAARTGAKAIRLNDECRSYHLGWVLYVWSDWAAAAGKRV